MSAELYKKRPDLVNAGRTLFGRLRRATGGDLNYFGPTSDRVEDLLIAVQTEMMRMGSPMVVRHNEVASASNEMSPVRVANASTATATCCSEVCPRRAKTLGPRRALPREALAGINGNGKHELVRRARKLSAMVQLLSTFSVGMNATRSTRRRSPV